MPKLFARRPIAAPDSQGFSRQIGGLGLVALGVGGIIGTGIFVITGTAAALHAGPAVALSFVIAAFACLLAAMCYAELATVRSEEHTSELQSLMRISYAVFCLNKKKNKRK